MAAGFAKVAEGSAVFRGSLVNTCESDGNGAHTIIVTLHVADSASGNDGLP